jgi:hypothetical protein
MATISRAWPAVAALVFALSGPVDAAPAQPKPIVLKDTDLALAPPTSTIYWSVGKDGKLALSDRPDPQAPSRGANSYRSSSDPESLARAKREREYWRAQADAFAARQRERDRDLEEARRFRVLSAERQSIAGYGGYVGVPVVGLRAPVGAWPGGAPPGGAQVGIFTSPQSAAPGTGPAPFLSSGFATGLRR